MYNSRPGLLVGFHGCETSTRNNPLNNPDSVQKSNKPYDWLGHGMYFWENNFDRALQWAKDKKKRGEINNPAVIGAILDLGYCCDFTDSRFISMVGTYHNLLALIYKEAGQELPQNKDLRDDEYKDKILRELDCKVIEFMHDQIITQVAKDITLKGYSDYKLFDSVRGMFTEGGPAYHGAGIKKKTHVQICVRNLNCILGFFLPRKETNFLKQSLLRSSSA